MFCHPQIKAARKSKTETFLAILFVFILSLIGNYSIAQFSKPPALLRFEKSYFAHNDNISSQIVKVTNSMIDTVASTKFSETTLSGNSDTECKYLIMNPLTDSNKIKPSVLCLKKENEKFGRIEIIGLKNKPEERVRGSRKRLGIYMTVAGISIIVAALIINSKN